MKELNYLSNQSETDSHSLLEIMEKINNSKAHLEIVFALAQMFYPNVRLLNSNAFLLPTDKNIAEALSEELKNITRNERDQTLGHFASGLQVLDWELFNNFPQELLKQLPIVCREGQLNDFLRVDRFPFADLSSFRTVSIFGLSSPVSSTTLCVVLIFSSELSFPIDPKVLSVIFSQAENRIEFLKAQARLKLISEIGFKVNSITTIEETLKFLLDEMYNVRPYDYASAGLIDRKNATFELYEIRGMSQSQEQWFEENMSLKAHEYIKWALDQEDRTMARIVNVNEEGFVPPLIPGQVKSFLNIPLVYESELMGIITLANSSKPLFDLDDLKMYCVILREVVSRLKTLIGFQQPQIKLPGKRTGVDTRKDEVDSLKLEFRFPEVFTRNDAMRNVFGMVKKMTDSSVNVLIMGETGTGKEILARAIHFNSPRKNKRFVAINCVALNEGVLESELFGHAKGAFTGAYRDKMGKMERANGGTLFLDEVGDIPMNIQAKLLRAIQEREVERVGSNKPINLDIRIISATSKDLRREISRGAFRKDLFFRLNTVMIELPQLKDRFQDIPFLADMFLDFYCKKHSLASKRLSQRALNQLMAYDWPGNVRELENVIEKSVIFSEDTTIQSIELNSDSSFPHQMQDDLALREDLTFSELKNRMLREMEKKYLTDLLKRFRGNVTQAIKYSKIDRKNFYKKLKRYQINPHLFRQIPSE